MNRYAATGRSDQEVQRTFSSKREANDYASRVRFQGDRVLIHDLQAGVIIRDTGKPHGQVWAFPSRKGEPSPLPKIVLDSHS